MSDATSPLSHLDEEDRRNCFRKMSTLQLARCATSLAWQAEFGLIRAEIAERERNGRWEKKEPRWT